MKQSYSVNNPLHGGKRAETDFIVLLVITFCWIRQLCQVTDGGNHHSLHRLNMLVVAMSKVHQKSDDFLWVSYQGISC